MKDILVNTLMKKGVRCISPDARLADVLSIMRENNYSCVIVSEADKPVGIIAERDFVKILADTKKGSNLLSMSVYAAMSSPVITVKEQDSLLRC